MNDLLLVRHAAAEPAEGPERADDDARPLSARGRRRFRAVVAGLDALGVRLAVLVHSPKLRAIQTAELLLPLLEGVTEVTPLLADAPGAALDALVEERVGAGPVALVGHQPWLGELVDQLVAPGAGGGIDWKKGGVVWLRRDEAGPWRVRAVLPPSVLTRG